MQKIYLLILFILEWFALIMQFYINMHNRILSISESIIRYFSYFTILTNLLTAVCITFLLFKPHIKLTNFFLKQSTQTAIAVYIFIVALIYNLILRFTWNPQGLQKPVDELLHLINPFLFIIYWWLFSNNHQLKWKIIWFWLIYPFFYIVFVLSRAVFSGFYAYPFLDVKNLGANKVLFNCAGIAVLFILISVIFLTVGNYIAKTNTKISS